MEQKQIKKSNNFFKKIGNKIKSVPWYGWVGSLAIIITQIILYNIAKVIVWNWSYKWVVIPKLPVIDNGIPFVPYFFIEVYCWAFPFWIFGPIVASLTKKERFINFFIAVEAMEILSFFIFIFAPSYLDRVQEGLIFENGNFTDKILGLKPSLGKELMKLIIKFDGGRYCPNCIPSLHCSLSLILYIAIARQKEVSLGSRIYALIISILIGWSTLFTKQHYFIDMVTGWIMAIFCWFLFAIVINPGKRILDKHPNFLIIKKKPKTELDKQIPSEVEQPTKIESKEKE